ncbi:hypothetical protein PsAD2_02675 [Pseudovibrio axinellae]|uniref:Prolyl 4-hydroxylase alpha subunit Fe(2+) 2OG dioxygenase domain-containing protein n=1 Tax=Pseudovibrio axinellae TaxID=989403 RepID=A0A165XQG9_9HYPH|nr:2OG-Fe(II) oxygenase [Pseudovibrio axinellae]KZL17942.1 hypothetical protein PsAD2_02675 [Pseudovibrio axinellae]SER15859.1 hypothetical protein SAMN05421798_106305 [Pseudovibrio axinellae]
MSNASCSNQISTCISHALRQATRDHSPFPHWTADNILPCKTLSELQHLPTCQLELDHRDGQRASNNKFRQYLHGDTFIKYEVEQEISAVFQSPSIVELLSTMCAIDLSGCFLRIEYACDKDGFWLEPHTDIGAKKFTLLLYLSRSCGKDLGTSLYSDKHTFHSNAPWAPNRAVFFVPSDRSWHGFHKRRITNPRKSLIINYVCPAWRAKNELAFPQTLTDRSTNGAKQELTPT